MVDVTASRTLVKSHPELWTECSDAESLARHLDGFGEIRITRLEPETAVAWEGERASGTVRLEPSGWGTRVVLTATPAPAPESLSAVAPEPEAVAQPEPVAAAGVPEAPRPGLFARLFGRWRPRRPDAESPPPEAPPPPAPPEAAELGALEGPEAALAAALDSLGRAHHRPFSRG